MTGWLVVTVVITATYSANLIAFLSVKKHRVPFSTLHELSLQHEYEFGVLGGTAQMMHVKVCVCYLHENCTRNGNIKIVTSILFAKYRTTLFFGVQCFKLRCRFSGKINF